MLSNCRPVAPPQRPATERRQLHSTECFKVAHVFISSSLYTVLTSAIQFNASPCRTIWLKSNVSNITAVASFSKGFELTVRAYVSTKHSHVVSLTRKIRLTKRCNYTPPLDLLRHDLTFTKTSHWAFRPHPFEDMFGKAQCCIPRDGMVFKPKNSLKIWTMGRFQDGLAKGCLCAIRPTPLRIHLTPTCLIVCNVLFIFDESI